MQRSSNSICFQHNDCKTKITSGKSSKGKVNLKWQKVNGAAGYVVYRSTKKGSRYTKIAEITKGSTVKYTDKTAKKGKKTTTKFVP